jgi:hypothetical protein
MLTGEGANVLAAARLTDGRGIDGGGHGVNREDEGQSPT